ncbi:MAG: hypothetical protein HOW73_01555 [Polyangiaceae bacterium]|nr:hypothetical protein [Polyangiaceae bacterium]
MKPGFIARWDLDKTYLRTDFETVRDLVRTAVERPDQKRTVPGAAALLRELGRAGVQTHILSGSPEQLRSRIVEKLRLDGVRYASLTLKPNLQNILRFRWRALRGQLGYKLPALLLGRCELTVQHDDSGELVREVLLGDDAEADAFVYCLYSDVCRGVVGEALLSEVLQRGGAYEDSIRDAVRLSKYIAKGPVVQRILIHLERQSAPSDFKVFGPRVVPFYNYLQAAFVLFEDARIPAEAVLSIATDLTIVHNFERSALSRSYLDLARRGHVTGARTGDLKRSLTELLASRRSPAASELVAMIETIESAQHASPAADHGTTTEIDYLALVAHHNPRHRRKKR